MSKKILVIMPTYNREEFLDKAIQSVLNQTYSNLILCVVDDCSTDSSLAIANKYKKEDDRVLVLKNPKNLGCYAARNLGLFKCKDLDWDLFTIHDPDDYSSDDRLHKISQPFVESKLMGMKTTFTKVDRSGVPQLRVGMNEIEVTASEGIAIFTRRAFKTLGYFDDTRFSGDTDYWWRAQAFCDLNPDHTLGQHLGPLYSAVSHENNLTKIYNFHTDRPKYFQKSMSEIRSKMIPSNNFYRDFTMQV